MQQPALVLSLAMLTVGAVPVYAALVPCDFDRLLRESQQIVCGQVTAVECRWQELEGIGEVILSRVTIRRSETWKGDGSTASVTLTFLGGTVGDDFQYCAESPRFEKDEHVLVFLKEHRGRDGELWCTGWSHGKYRLRSTDPEGRVPKIVVGRRGAPLTEETSLLIIRETVRRRLAELAVATTAPVQNEGR